MKKLQLCLLQSNDFPKMFHTVAGISILLGNHSYSAAKLSHILHFRKDSWVCRFQNLFKCQLNKNNFKSLIFVACIWRIVTGLFWNLVARYLARCHNCQQSWPWLLMVFGLRLTAGQHCNGPTPTNFQLWLFGFESRDHTDRLIKPYYSQNIYT